MPNTAPEQKTLHVAVGIVFDGDGRVLLAKRAEHKHQGGLWEFPGGKCEPNEQVQQALARELHEELGIRVTASQPLVKLTYAYQAVTVLLDVWLVDGYSGLPHGREGQPLLWQKLEQLDEIAMPAANQAIVTALQLPTKYLITPDSVDADYLFTGIKLAVAQGQRLIQLRAPQLSQQAYQELIERLAALVTKDVHILLKGSYEQQQQWPLNFGWHLDSGQLKQLATLGGRPCSRQRLLAASCHNQHELELANHIEADIVCLSPVKATSSHPQTQPLGWQQTADLLRYSSMPVYLLGGMQAQDLPQARQLGALGIAAITSLWPL